MKSVAPYGCAVLCNCMAPSPIRRCNQSSYHLYLKTVSGKVTLPTAAAKDPLELTHNKILKWVLGVHKTKTKKASITTSATVTLADFPGILPIEDILVCGWQRQHNPPPHIQRAEGAQTKLKAGSVHGHHCFNGQLLHDCRTKLKSCPSIM